MPENTENRAICKDPHFYYRQFTRAEILKQFHDMWQTHHWTGLRYEAEKPDHMPIPETMFAWFENVKSWNGLLRAVGLDPKLTSRKVSENKRATRGYWDTDVQRALVRQRIIDFCIEHNNTGSTYYANNHDPQLLPAYTTVLKIFGFKRWQDLLTDFGLTPSPRVVSGYKKPKPKTVFTFSSELLNALRKLDGEALAK